jgi:PilZ domain
MSQNQPQARAPRFSIRLSAELKVDAHRVTGTTRNLSIGGVCVEIDRPVAEGKLIQMTLFVVEDDVETEGARGLELTGTVQWMAEGDRNYAVGIKFGNLNSAQTTALTNALKAVGEPPP